MERRERLPEPAPRETPTTEAETRVEPEVEPTQPPAAAEESGEETVNVQLDGAVFAFPDYLDDIGWAQKSGVTAFDLEAQGAVEAAGRSLAFGPLPKGYPRDQLRVSFYFDPRN
jgi:hypothetical protein